MRLVWTLLAREDRKAIREYIAADNPSAALNFDELLSEKAVRLADYPGLGRPGRLQGTREFVVHRNYMVVYDIAGNVVRVLRVLHAARRWPPVKY